VEKNVKVNMNNKQNYFLENKTYPS
jgi:hypothetical protein